MLSKIDAKIVIFALITMILARFLFVKCANNYDFRLVVSYASDYNC